MSAWSELDDSMLEQWQLARDRAQGNITKAGPTVQYIAETPAPPPDPPSWARQQLVAWLVWPHANTNVDGFMHNCVAHPLLWLSIRIERRGMRRG